MSGGRNMVMQNEAVQEAVRRLQEACSPLRVVLFGSRALGHARPDSDYDLLLVVPDGADHRTVALAARRSVAGLGPSFDFVVATSSEVQERGALPGTVLRAALTEGIDVLTAGQLPPAPASPASNLDDPQLREMVKRLVASFSPVRISLIGARARGDTRPDTDYELLVETTDPTELQAAALAMRRSLHDLPVGKVIRVTRPHQRSEEGPIRLYERN